MKQLKVLATLAFIGLFTTLGFAQGTTATTTPAATAAKELTASATVDCSDGKFHTAVAKGEQTLARASCANMKPSTKGVKKAKETFAKIGAAENGRLVLIKCDGSHAVVPTTETGTRVELVGVCSAPVVQVSQGVVVTDHRMIVGATQAATPVVAASATASAIATAQAPAATSAASDATGISLWHDPTATATSPKPCIISEGEGLGLPKYCSSFKVTARNPGETLAKWLVRVGGGTRPTSTGVYNKGNEG